MLVRLLVARAQRNADSFSGQDYSSDPPVFAWLELISCRNVVAPLQPPSTAQGSIATAESVRAVKAGPRRCSGVSGRRWLKPSCGGPQAHTKRSAGYKRHITA